TGLHYQRFLSVIGHAAVPLLVSSQLRQRPLARARFDSHFPQPCITDGGSFYVIEQHRHPRPGPVTFRYSYGERNGQSIAPQMPAESKTLSVRGRGDQTIVMFDFAIFRVITSKPSGNTG
ncbi:MAG: hypothetical protein Q9180_005080, partial [Flavoplaca navasiana]